MNYSLIIIGGGPAGYTAAETAGKAGLKVLLIEKQNLGGTCLNEGCIPTKTLLYAAKIHDQALHASKYAVSTGEVKADLPKIVARKGKVVRKLVLGIKAKLQAAGVEVLSGCASLVDAHTVSCNDATYTADHILLCTGSETFLPPIDGLESVPYWTHREALDAKELPSSLGIIGGGVIGMEFASFFNSLGVEVTVIEMADEILGGMERSLSADLRAVYAKRGIRFVLGAAVTQMAETEGQTEIVFKQGETEGRILVGQLLLSVGRKPFTEGLGLENLSLARTPRGHLQVDEQMRTSVPHIFACGDLTGFSLLAHTAVREAEVAVHTILGKTDSMSYRAIPAVVYTQPEIAGVGETTESATRKGLAFRELSLPMAFSGRFVAENEGVNGTCKVLVDESDCIIGAHLLGNPASEIITLAGMAIEMGLTLEQWKRMVFPHPTVSEIWKETIGQ